MEMCSRCGINENEIRIFDAIYEGRMTYLCERCSIIENIPIIKKPDIGQLKESEQAIKVYQRMKNISGIRDEKKDQTFFKQDELKELELNPNKELPEKKQLKLVEHFNWKIMKSRRFKGLTKKKLSDLLGESEIAIQMIEKNKLPENPEKLISKLEQFFQINLRELNEMEKYLKEKNSQPILLDEQGKEIDFIPEPEPVIIEQDLLNDDESINLDSLEQSKHAKHLINLQDSNEESIFEEKYYPIIKNKQIGENISKPPIEINNTEIIKNQNLIHNKESINNQNNIQYQENHKNKNKENIPPASIEIPKDFNIRKADLGNITIDQLNTMHRKKIEVTRQEQIEEQRKIEERQRILEALREKDRLKKEQKIQQEKINQQKILQERQNIINEKRQELQLIRKRESDEIDQYLGGIELLNKDPEETSTKIDKQDNVEEFDKELI